jgi:catalase
LDLVFPLIEAERTKPVPSYANCRFNSLSTFVWTKGHARCYVRYSWIPVEGGQSISKDEALKRPADYLQQDVAQRLGSDPVGPLRFRLQVQVASREDEVSGRVIDPVQIWPAPARVLTVGQVELTRLVDGPATRREALGFNPLNLTKGIQPSGDEILKFRHAVYDMAAKDRVAGHNQ